jgi:predicted nucleic acid-binding Zn ribbon protein
MEISSILIGLLLFGASVAYVILPFQQKRQKTSSPLQHSNELPVQREVVLAALRDLDFDFKTGKISEEDYQLLRVQLLAEAAQYIGAEKKGDEQLEQMIQSRRKVKRQENKCPHCETPVQAGQRLCSECGFELNSKLCPSCGKKIQSGDLFCSSCGYQIQISINAVA